MEKIRYTKQDIDEMGRDELEMFLTDCEDGVFEDYHKYDIEDGLYSYAVDRMFRMDYDY